ncbi:hypothetical protein L7F22_060086 [Adiantum nelumboides]|nr:hypothetical protein [Adiantum nelumboides]
MEFPHRGGDDGYHHHPHRHAQQTRAMEFSDEERYQHPQYYQEEQPGYGYEQEGYPPTLAQPAYAGYAEEGHPCRSPVHAYTRTSHTPDAFAQYTAPPAGPYGTHSPSGPYYSHSHHERPTPHEAFASEYPPSHHQPQLPQGQLVRVFCKTNQAFNLAVEHNNVIMKAADTEDDAQQWIKDDSYGMRVRDNYGHTAFSLVNKKTGKILKHPKEKGHQVLLMDYRPDIRDDDILWSESQDFGEGFKTVRCASNTFSI